jgi:flagellar biogenesis protein FliO
VFAAAGRAAVLVALVLTAGGAASGEEARGADGAPRPLAAQTVGDLLRDEAGGAPAAQPPPSTTGVFLRMIGWTALVVAAAGALLLAFRRFTPAGRILAAGGPVRVLARTALSPRHSVYVLGVARRRVLVVGVSGDRMVTLSELSDESQVLGLHRDFSAQLEAFEDEGSMESRRAAERDGGGAGGDLTGGGDGGLDLRPFQREIQSLRRRIAGWRSLVRRGLTGGALGEKRATEQRS